MSRNVSIISCKGYKYIRVCESYRNAQGQPRSKVIENHGRLDAALTKDPDYVVKLKERVARENEAARAARFKALEDDAQTRIRRLQRTASGEPDYSCVKPLNIGAALIRQVWKDLALPQVFRYLQSKSKIEYSYDKAAFLLSSERILHPGSKRNTFYGRDRSIVPFDEISDINVIYRVLDRLSQDKANIVRHLNREINKRLNRTVTAAFYDVTTYAFESRNADELRNFGLSKDHKVNEVQVVLGLVMDEYGIPIDYDLFEGSTSEFGTMLPMIKRIRHDYDLKKLVVVADRGLNSNENLLQLRDLQCDFVIAQKIKNCAEEQQAIVLDSANWQSVLTDDDGVVISYKTLDVKKEIYETRVSPKTGRKYKVGKPIDELDVRWIVSYSRSRAKKDNSDIDRAVEKARKALANGTNLLKARGYRSLIDIPKGEGTPKLDLEKIAEARKWAGYYAVCTNLKAESSQDVMAIYRNLWRIEDCFRVSKSMLETRPCFVWTPEHIRGHFMSCYISLVLEKYMAHVLQSHSTEFTAEKICRALRSAIVVYDDDVQYPQYQRAYETETGFDEMLRIFGLEPPLRREDKRSLAKKLRLKEISAG